MGEGLPSPLHCPPLHHILVSKLHIFSITGKKESKLPIYPKFIFQRPVGQRVIYLIYIHSRLSIALCCKIIKTVQRNMLETGGSCRDRIGEDGDLYSPYDELSKINVSPKRIYNI